MKLAEIAEILGTGRDDVKELVRTGQLGALRFGCWCLIRPRDVEEYIARSLPAGAP